MAITLRNQKVEAQIREIGKRTGEGPSAVIARLTGKEAERLEAERQQQVEERLVRMRAFRATLPHFSAEERKAAWDDLNSMHDYLYEDGSEGPT